MFKTDAGIDYYSSASEPSMDEPGRPQDESAFKNFETNIIVGKMEMWSKGKTQILKELILMKVVVTLLLSFLIKTQIR